MDRNFLARLSASTNIYVNFENAIQVRFNQAPYLFHDCYVHYTDAEVRDLRLAGILANPAQINFFTVSYQTKKLCFLIHTLVDQAIIESLAMQHGIEVNVTVSRRVLNMQTRISVENNNPDAVVAFLLALAELAFRRLI